MVQISIHSMIHGSFKLRFRFVTILSPAVVEPLCSVYQGCIYMRSASHLVEMRAYASLVPASAGLTGRAISRSLTRAEWSALRGRRSSDATRLVQDG